jgi:hypothetical protein
MAMRIIRLTVTFRYFVGFHSRAIRSASAIWAGTRVYRRLPRHFQLQARPFYERHGYAVFATQEDNPPGHARHFLEKRLS